MYAIKKIKNLATLYSSWKRRSLGSLSLKSFILVKKQEPEQDTKCPGSGNTLKSQQRLFKWSHDRDISEKKYQSTRELDWFLDQVRVLSGSSTSTFWG